MGGVSSPTALLHFPGHTGLVTLLSRLVEGHCLPLAHCLRTGSKLRSPAPDLSSLTRAPSSSRLRHIQESLLFMASPSRM